MDADQPIPKSVLVVDDEPMVLALLQEIVRRLGYRVHAAASGAEAVRKLSCSGDIGLVLTDIDMLEMTGLELRDKLRRHDQWQRIPVVFMTGGVGMGLLPTDRVLHKPFAPIQVWCAIASHLGGTCPAKRTRTMPDGSTVLRSHPPLSSASEPAYCDDPCEHCGNCRGSS